MPNSRKRKIEDFKNKIRKKMRKIKQMMDDFSTSDSDSDNTRGAVSDSDSGESFCSEHVDVDVHEPPTPPQLPPEDSIETLLGAIPSNHDAEGPELAPDVATRWEAYLSLGLDKETRKKLIERYNTPSNCKYLKAPTLNPEVEVLLSAPDVKKDRFLKNLQEIMGKGIAAEGQALSKLLEQRDTIDASVTQALVDSGKLLTDMFHTLSTHTKYQTYKYFNEPVQKLASQQKIDNFLFGSDFAEKCKVAKTVEASAKDLQKPSTTRDPKTTVVNLNSQRPPLRKKARPEEKRGGDRHYGNNRQRQRTPREYKEYTRTTRTRATGMDRHGKTYRR